MIDEDPPADGGDLLDGADLHGAAETVRALAILENKESALKFSGESSNADPKALATGWIVAAVVAVMSIVFGLWVYLVTLEPLVSELHTLREQLVVSQEREEKLVEKLKESEAQRVQLEAAADALIRRVEEQQGEKEAMSGRQNELDAAIRLQQEKLKKLRRRRSRARRRSR